MNPGAGEFPAASSDGIVYGLQVEDVDAEFARLRSEGLEFEDQPADMPWGDRPATLRDPNGIQLYLYQPIPVSVEFRDAIR